MVVPKGTHKLNSVNNELQETATTAGGNSLRKAAGIVPYAAARSRMQLLKTKDSLAGADERKPSVGIYSMLATNLGSGAPASAIESAPKRWFQRTNNCAKSLACW